MSIRVLVVDDEVYLAAAVAEALSQAGMDTLTAFDGKEALAKIAELGPDVVVLDRDLPRLHGDEV